VIACDDVIQNAQTKPLLRLEKPMKIAATIPRKLQEKFSLVATVSDVPDVSREKVSVRARHRYS